MKRIQLAHDNLWRAVIKAPLVFFYILMPFFFAMLLSPLFTGEITLYEWFVAFLNLIFIAFLVYINGILGSFFFGTWLYFFLNAIRMQSKYIYWLTGFAAGTVFNLLYPWYSQYLGSIKDFPPVAGRPLAEIGVAFYPIAFGLMGMAVAWSFWRILSKAGPLDAD